MAWKYISVLNSLLQILSTVCIGILLGRTKIVSAKTFVPSTIQFVFYVALPCLVVRGLGVSIDLYNEIFLWDYIAAWIMLRFVSLLISFLVAPLVDQKVVVVWLILTWISTVILGVPISKAIFDNEEKGRFYGLLAGISSFIFQLPFMLFMMERHTVANALGTGIPIIGINDNDTREADTNQSEIPCDCEATSVPSNLSLEEEVGTKRHAQKEPNEGLSSVAQPSICTGVCMDRLTWYMVFRKVAQNPVILAIAAGLFLSLTKIGRFFNANNKSDFVEGLGFIGATLGWLGDCVSPVSLLAMGVWIQSQGFSKLATALPFHHTVYFMLSKLVMVPLLMVGLTRLVTLSNEAGRASILIAALPISLASFSLGHQYQVGEAALAANVAVGTLLMLPTILIWNIVLDELGLYPI